MNSKKCFVLITTLISFSIGLNTTLWGQEQKDPNEDPNNKVKLLEEKVKRLEGIIENQTKTIRRLETENKRLKNLCSQSGIDISLQKDKESSKEESKTRTKVSIEQLRQLGITSSQLTTVQREKLYKEREILYEKTYSGQYIQWTGEINTVERKGKGYFISFNNSSALGFVGRFPVTSRTTVTVEFPEDESLERRILSLNKGSIVTYEGKLPDNYDKIQSLSKNLSHKTLLTSYDVPNSIKESSTFSFVYTLSLTDGRIIKYP